MLQDVVSTEHLQNDFSVEGERETYLHRLAFQLLVAASLDPASSRALILETAESHWSGVGLDTLLTALYVELTDRIIPSLGLARSGPGRPPEVTDAELVCLAVAQVLLRYDDERHWLRAAPRWVGHLFPRLLRQSEYNDRLKAAAPLMEAALRWLAGQTPGSAEPGPTCTWARCAPCARAGSLSPASRTALPPRSPACWTRSAPWSTGRGGRRSMSCSMQSAASTLEVSPRRSWPRPSQFAAELIRLCDSDDRRMFHGGSRRRGNDAGRGP